jgi:ribosomal protein S17E
MGKSMSNKIKAKAKIILKEFKTDLSVDFRKNKEFLKKMELPLSKLTVNLMSGYITRVRKQEKKEQESLKIDTSKTQTIPTKKPINKDVIKS